MFNPADYPMTVLGVIAALVVFGIFIGTWWFNAMREKHA